MSTSITPVPVSELADGQRFAWRGEVWEATVKHDRIVAYREGGFGARVWFYDPVTAAKAGEHSWATQVEPL